MRKLGQMVPISGGAAELDALIAQAQVNNDLLSSITTFLQGVAAIIETNVAQATELGQLKSSMTDLAASLKAQDDPAAAALVAATPAAPQARR